MVSRKAILAGSAALIAAVGAIGFFYPLNAVEQTSSGEITCAWKVAKGSGEEGQKQRVCITGVDRAQLSEDDLCVYKEVKEPNLPPRRVKLCNINRVTYGYRFKTVRHWFDFTYDYEVWGTHELNNVQKPFAEIQINRRSLFKSFGPVSCYNTNRCSSTVRDKDISYSAPCGAMYFTIIDATNSPLKFRAFRNCIGKKAKNKGGDNSSRTLGGGDAIGIRPAGEPMSEQSTPLVEPDNIDVTREAK